MIGTPRQEARPPGGGHLAIGDTADSVPTTVTVHVAVEFGQRRGRKLLVASDPDSGEPLQQSAARSGNELTPAVRALARAFRWRKLLETGAIATVHEIAAAEHINPSYVSRVIRLTLLSPEIVEALTTHRSGGIATSMDLLLKPVPVPWQAHESMFGPVAMCLRSEGEASIG